MGALALTAVGVLAGLRWQQLVVAIEAAPPAAQTQTRRPNVLLIMADDLGNELGVSTYTGNVPAASTPNIDALAARGVTFDRAYNQYPLCGPSRASFLTGLRPDTIGIYDLSTHFRQNVPDVVTLPQFFKNNGYHTARVGKIFHYDVPADIGTDGLDDPVSWHERFNPKGFDTENPETIIRQPGRQDYREDQVPDERETDGMIASQAIRLLEQNRSRPFFLAVGFFRPHFPYVSPKKYFDMYPLESMQVPGDPMADLADVPPAAVTFTRPPNWDMTAEQMALAKRAYYAGISFMDAQVGRVMVALDRLGLRNNTIVVFMSDHGYNLGQKGQWMKQSLYEHSARNPLIVSAPGAAQNAMNTRVVEYLDLYPTLLDLAGFPVSSRLEGRSLKPLLSNPAHKWDDFAITQVIRGGGGRRGGDGEGAAGGGRGRGAGQGRRGGGAGGAQQAFMGYSIRTTQWRYTEWDGGAQGTELYDEINDPGEVLNLASDPKYADVVKTLKARMPKRPRVEAGDMRAILQRIRTVVD
jgi:uncharacterized sulfatase